MDWPLHLSHNFKNYGMSYALLSFYFTYMHYDHNSYAQRGSQRRLAGEPPAFHCTIALTSVPSCIAAFGYKSKIYMCGFPYDLYK